MVMMMLDDDMVVVVVVVVVVVEVLVVICRVRSRKRIGVVWFRVLVLGRVGG